MRKRKWVLVLALCITFLITGGYAAWRLTGADEKIRNILLSRMRPFLAQESDLGKVTLTLSSITMKGVRLASADRSFSIEIEEVRLGIRLLNLIRYRFALSKIAYEILLVGPSITVNTSAVVQDEGAPEEGPLDYHAVMNELEGIRRFGVIRGEIRFEDSSGRSLLLAQNLNGWLAGITPDSASLRLTGRFFESVKNNVLIEGGIDLPAARLLGLDVRIDESELASALPFFIPDYLFVSGGTMSGRFGFRHGEAPAGVLEIHDGDLQFKKAHLAFQGIEMRSVLERDTVTLRGSMDFNGSSCQASGLVTHLEDPVLDLVLRSRDFDIHRFFRRTFVDTHIPLGGRALIDFQVSGTLPNPRLTGRFDSPDFSAYGVAFERLQMDFGMRDSVLSLEGFGMQEEGLSLLLDGSVDFSSPGEPASLSLNLEGDPSGLLPPLFREHIRSAHAATSIRLAGRLRALEGKADGILSVVSDAGDTLRITPDFSYTGRDLGFSLASNTSFQMKGVLHSPFHGSLEWTGESSGLEELAGPFLGKQARTRLQGMTLQCTASGDTRAWTAAFGAVAAADSTALSGLFSSRAESKSSRSLELRAAASWKGGKMPIMAEGVWHQGGLNVKHLQLGGLVSAKAYIPFRTSERMEARIDFTEGQLDELHGLFPQLVPFEGTLGGVLTASGPRQSPAVNAEISLRKGYFHGVGKYDMRLRYVRTEEHFQEAGLALYRDNALTFSGNAALEGDSLAGGFTGDKLDLGILSLAFTGKETIQGTGTVRLAVSGKPEAPVFSGVVEAYDGRLGPVSFQELHSEIVDSLRPGPVFGENMMRGALSISKGRLDRKDGTRALVWGTLQHGSEDASDLSLQVQGNILGVLPELSPAVKKASGEGEVFLRWTGGPGTWALEGGRLALEKGEADLSTFLEQIRNLKAEASLAEDRFLSIAQITGTVNGERFSITNRNDAKLEPLGAGKAGFHLGVLEIESAGKGVEVNIPGLMEPGENGILAFAGLDSTESTFILAGPSASPLVQGTLYLRDVRFTYPFLELKGDSSGNLDFLKNVRWNLRLIAEEDVHYVRSIDAFLGSMYLDLKLRDHVGEVRIRGAVAEKDLEVWGNVVSTEGSLDMMDHLFRPEQITLDLPKGANDAVISGRAYTTVTDSMGMPSTVWLTLTTIDRNTGLVQEGGPWSRTLFQFSSDNPNLGRTQADLLAAMGFSESMLRERAYDALGMQVESLVFRPLLRPLERTIRKYLGLDVVRFSSMFSRNLALSAMNPLDFDARTLLRSAKITVGKYLTPDLFFTYSGQVHDGLGVGYSAGIGYRHSLSLEYTIAPDLFLMMEYIYDSYLLSDRREDKRIWLRHVFPF